MATFTQQYNTFRQLLQNVIQNDTEEELALLSQTNFFNEIRRQMDENGSKPEIIDIKKEVDRLGGMWHRKLQHNSPVKIMKNRPKFVLLVDFDGTIAETEMIIYKATNMMLKENGFTFQWTLEEYYALLMIGNTEARLTHYFNLKSCWPKEITSIKDRAAYVKKLKKYKDRCFDILLLEKDGGETFQCRPGILSLMEKVIYHLDGKCCIVSNTSTKIVRKLFKLLILNDKNNSDCQHHTRNYNFLIDSVHIIGGDMVATNKRKPAPDLYMKALKEMGCNDVNHVVVIEDSADGLNAALNANIRNVIITKNIFTKDQNFDGARLIFENELPDEFSIYTLWPNYVQSYIMEDTCDDKLIAKVLLEIASNKVLIEKVSSIYQFTKQENLLLVTKDIFECEPK